MHLGWHCTFLMEFAPFLVVIDDDDDDLVSLQKGFWCFISYWCHALAWWHHPYDAFDDGVGFLDDDVAIERVFFGNEASFWWGDMNFGMRQTPRIIPCTFSCRDMHYGRWLHPWRFLFSHVWVNGCFPTTLYWIFWKFSISIWGPTPQCPYLFQCDLPLAYVFVKFSPF